MENRIEIETLHLFPIVDGMLISLLTDLTESDWELQTVAKLWKVKDVAAHLLDGNLRGLSTSRDSYFGMDSGVLNSHEDLVKFLNGLNLSWTQTLKRLSPRVLISLLEHSGQEYAAHLRTLELFESSVFPVAWAGQEVSFNWFHIAREYTEKFLHQQQIREATGRAGLMTQELFYPFIDTLMYALPHTYRNVPAEEGTSVSVVITTEIGGRWNLIKAGNQWHLNKEAEIESNSIISIDPGSAWKLFSKSWTAEQVLDRIAIQGDKELALQTLNMVSVMA